MSLHFFDRPLTEKEVKLLEQGVFLSVEATRQIDNHLGRYQNRSLNDETSEVDYRGKQTKGS